MHNLPADVSLPHGSVQQGPLLPGLCMRDAEQQGSAHPHAPAMLVDLKRHQRASDLGEKVLEALQADGCCRIKDLQEHNLFTLDTEGLSWHESRPPVNVPMPTSICLTAHQQYPDKSIADQRQCKGKASRAWR